MMNKIAAQMDAIVVVRLLIRRALEDEDVAGFETAFDDESQRINADVAAEMGRIERRLLSDWVHLEAEHDGA